MSHIDAAHWWGPIGWLYRNTPGNLAASAIAFTAGYMLKGRQMLKHLTGLHEKVDANHAELKEALSASNETSSTG